MSTRPLLGYKTVDTFAGKSHSDILSVVPCEDIHGHVSGFYCNIRDVYFHGHCLTY
jgi:hypothetical protein